LQDRGVHRLTSALALFLGLTAAVLSPVSVSTQTGGDAFLEMANTERAFAARAMVVGWKQSFLEFFADSAVGFDGGAGPAKDQIRKNPDPPAGFQLLWEPRFGDIAASGDLGWLTGPSTSINPARQPSTRYGTYSSVWKRQADGTFKVVLDVGVNAPGQVEFVSGLTRADRSDRYVGDDTLQAATQALALADAGVNANGGGNREGLLAMLARDGRVHRVGWMPLIGRAAADIWVNNDGDRVRGTTRFAEVAASRDLGYTWGSYSAPALIRNGQPVAAESGYYVRVWTRNGDGSWKIALDVLQPGA
jgi:ketosteroid isomerase-like protein